MRSIIQDGSDVMPPPVFEGAIHMTGGTIMRSIIQDGSDVMPPPVFEGAIHMTGGLK